MPNYLPERLVNLHSPQQSCPLNNFYPHILKQNSLMWIFSLTGMLTVVFSFKHVCFCSLKMEAKISLKIFLMIYAFGRM